MRSVITLGHLRSQDDNYGAEPVFRNEIFRRGANSVSSESCLENGV